MTAKNHTNNSTDTKGLTPEPIFNKISKKTLFLYVLLAFIAGSLLTTAFLLQFGKNESEDRTSGILPPQTVATSVTTTSEATALPTTNPTVVKTPTTNPIVIQTPTSTPISKEDWKTFVSVQDDISFKYPKEMIVSVNPGSITVQTMQKNHLGNDTKYTNLMFIRKNYVVSSNKLSPLVANDPSTVVIAEKKYSFLKEITNEAKPGYYINFITYFSAINSTWTIGINSIYDYSEHDSCDNVGLFDSAKEQADCYKRPLYKYKTTTEEINIALEILKTLKF
ncbi:hypothetical protein IT418_01780 [bacterium]|nr:hypothetical protein [bacterium]